MKLIRLSVLALAMAMAGVAPSQAAGVNTTIIFADSTGIPTSSMEGMWVVLDADDPRCEHDRVVRYETRASNSQPWKVIGQDTTRATATAALAYDPDDEKAQQAITVAARTLADGTQCRGEFLDIAVVRVGETRDLALSQRLADTGIAFLGSSDLVSGRMLIGGAIAGSPAKCRPNRSILVKADTPSGMIEVARDRTVGAGVFGVDFIPGFALTIVAAKKVLPDGTVCPKLTLVVE